MNKGQSMIKHLLVACFCASALAACGGATPEQQLKDSFVQQIVSSGFARDLQHQGDEVTFTGKRAEKNDAKWRVRLDAATVENDQDGKTPRKGTVKSSWFVDGEQIRPRGDQADLPLPILDAGLAQECWAFWDKSAGKWSWK
jgi:hypothetical protein